MQAYKVHTTSFLFDCAEEGIHPLEVPNDSRAAESYALLRPRVYLLHIELRSVVGIHIGLAFDVRLVEGHNVFGSVLMHFGDALIP